MELLVFSITEARAGQPLAGLVAHLRCMSHLFDAGFRGVSQEDGQITHWQYCGASPVSLANFIRDFGVEVTKWQVDFGMVDRFGTFTWPMAPVIVFLQEHITVKANLAIFPSTLSISSTTFPTKTPTKLSLVGPNSFRDVTTSGDSFSNAAKSPTSPLPSAASIQESKDATREDILGEYDDCDNVHFVTPMPRQAKNTLAKGSASPARRRSYEPRASSVGGRFENDTKVQSMDTAQGKLDEQPPVRAYSQPAAPSRNVIPSRASSVSDRRGVQSASESERLGSANGDAQAANDDELPAIVSAPPAVASACIMEHDNVVLNMACADCERVIEPYMAYCRHSQHPRGHHTAMFKQSARQREGAGIPELFTLSRSRDEEEFVCILVNGKYSLDSVCANCQQILREFISYSHKVHQMNNSQQNTQKKTQKHHHKPGLIQKVQIRLKGDDLGANSVPDQCSHSSDSQHETLLEYPSEKQPSLKFQHGEHLAPPSMSSNGTNRTNHCSNGPPDHDIDRKLMPPPPKPLMCSRHGRNYRSVIRDLHGTHAPTDEPGVEYPTDGQLAPPPSPVLRPVSPKVTRQSPTRSLNQSSRFSTPADGITSQDTLQNSDSNRGPRDSTRDSPFQVLGAEASTLLKVVDMNANVTAHTLLYSNLDSCDRLPSPLSPVPSPKPKQSGSKRRPFNLPGIEEFDRLAGLTILPAFLDRGRSQSSRQSRLPEINERATSAPLPSLSTLPSAPLTSLSPILTSTAGCQSVDTSQIVTKVDEPREGTRAAAARIDAMKTASAPVHADFEATYDADAEDGIIVDFSKQQGRRPCVFQRDDGQVVKLVCPDCQKEEFANAQGFITHCRNSHRRKFKTHEQAARIAGVPISKKRKSSLQKAIVVDGEKTKRGVKRHKQ